MNGRFGLVLLLAILPAILIAQQPSSIRGRSVDVPPTPNPNAQAVSMVEAEASPERTPSPNPNGQAVSMVDAEPSPARTHSPEETPLAQIPSGVSGRVVDIFTPIPTPLARIEQRNGRFVDIPAPTPIVGGAPLYVAPTVIPERQAEGRDFFDLSGWREYDKRWPTLSAEMNPYRILPSELYTILILAAALLILRRHAPSWRTGTKLFILFFLAHLIVTKLGGLAVLVILKGFHTMISTTDVERLCGIPKTVFTYRLVMDSIFLVILFVACKCWGEVSSTLPSTNEEDWSSKTHGSARWASWGELHANSLFHNTGIPLLRVWKQVGARRTGFIDRFADYIASLFRTEAPSPPPDSDLLQLQGDGHIIMIAPPGAGKTTGLVIPIALSWRGSLVVTDIKGEITAVTARRRMQLGQEVHVIDPFDQTGFGNQTAGIDILSLINSESWIDDCKHIAALLIPLPLRSSSNEDFWLMTSRNLLAGLVGYIWSSPELARAGKRNIVTLREYLGYGEEDFRTLLKGILGKLDAPKHVNGASADDFEEEPLPSPRRTVDPFISGALESYLGHEAKVRSSVHTQCRNATDFLDSPGVQRALSRATVDLHTLRKRPQTLFLAIPDKRISSHAGLLRLIAAAVMGAIKDCPHDPHRVLLLLDEFGNLGHMEMITKDMTLMRSYGTHICVIAQDIGQLTRIYGPEAFNSMVANSKAQIFARVGDKETAKYVSELLGVTTVRSRNESTGNNSSESTSESNSASSGTTSGYSKSGGGSRSYAVNGGPSHGSNWGDSSSSSTSYGASKGTTTGSSTGTSNSSGYSEHRRELMTPDEVLTVGAHELIIHLQNTHPIRGSRLEYFRDPEFAGQFDPNPYYNPS